MQRKQAWDKANFYLFFKSRKLDFTLTFIHSLEKRLQIILWGIF